MRLIGVIAVHLYLFLGEGIPAVWAQVITSSGLNTQISAPVTLPGGEVQHNITGGTRPGGGGNLFHSFGEFGVPTNNIANFLNDAALPTTNILSRVTGGNPSSIFGTIQTQGFGNANLFLMNPAGIVFGPNASLNVSGATHFTTADYLKLSDGVLFTAMPSAQDALLSVAPVAAFGFLESNPPSLSIEGSTLSVSESQTLSLVGGDITIGSSLNAPGGKIAVVSVASPGEVLADTYASGPNVNGQSFTAMGNISLVEGATLDVSGDAAGTVIIRGGQLMMTNATISADTGNENGAPVAINIDVTGDASISTGARALTARSSGTGNAGEIRLSSGGDMNISGMFIEEFLFPMIDTHTSGQGNGGNVIITSAGGLTAAGEDGFFIFFADTGTEGFDTGVGGNLSISTQNLEGANLFFSTGNFFSSFLGLDGPESAGDLVITATGKINLSSVDITLDSGHAGNVTFTAPETYIESSNISSAGFFQGGSVTFNADSLKLTESTIGTQTLTEPGGSVTFTGKKIELIGSSIVSTTNQNADAGFITITATEGVSLLNANKFPFTSGLDNPSSIASNSFSDDGSGILGAPGNILISTPFLELEGGSKINTSTGSSGSGGNVIINAENSAIFSGQTDRVNLGDLRDFGQFQASGIFTGSLGGNCAGPCGDAGDVNITTASLVMEKGAQINSGTTTDGKGGLINVNTSRNFSISGILEDGTPGGVFSRTTGTDQGSGAGGAILLTAVKTFTLSDRATVSASSGGPGNAGAIDIEVTAGSLTIAQGAVVNSGTTSTGAGGAITIDALDNISITGTMDGTASGVLSRTIGKDPGSGAGGTIALNAGQSFTLSDRATVSASSSGPGNAGDIAITAGAFTIAQGAVVDSGTTSTGAGGAISLIAGQNFTLSDGATVSASSSGPGDAGNINITAHDTILIQKASVTAEALQASGGNIKLKANDTIKLVDSTIASSVEGDVDTQGGNISLDPDFIILQNSQILAKAGAGKGGNISLIANDVVLVDSFSVLDATAATGISGTVTIESPIQNLSGTIVPLPQDPVPVTALYGSRCVAGEGGHFSTFVDSKSDSLAPTPGTFLASPFLPQSNLSKALALSHADKREGSETVQAALLQVAAYSPPVLFAQGDEMLTACP